MAWTLEEFLNRPPAEGRKCALRDCGNPISDTDPHPATHVEGVGLVCADCISNQVSEAIDTHPLGRPMATIAH